MIVCDTNVLVSAFAFPGGVPDRIVRSILSGAIEHATSPDILSELTRVLTRKLLLPEERAHLVRDLIAGRSKLVYPPERLRVIVEDEADNRILECADAALADFIVSGDKRHLLPLGRFQRALIISPRDFAVRVGL